MKSDYYTSVACQVEAWPLELSKPKEFLVSRAKVQKTDDSHHFADLLTDLQYRMAYLSSV